MSLDSTRIPPPCAHGSAQTVTASRLIYQPVLPATTSSLWFPLHTDLSSPQPALVAPFFNPSRSFLVLQNEIQTLSLAREAPRDLTGSLVPGPRVLCVPQDLTTHARNAHSPGLSAWGRCHSSFQSQPSRLSGKPPGPLSSSGLPCHFRSGSHPDPGPQTRPRDAPAPCNMSAVRTGACRVHLCAPAAQLKV